MNPIPELLEELRGGRMVVVMDDEERDGRAQMKNLRWNVRARVVRA